MRTINSTLNYYNENAKAYFDKTKDIDVKNDYNVFLKYLSKKANILDLGCGSGRDSKYFIKKGYNVTALDGSIELCNLATAYIGKPVLNMDFIDLRFNNEFNGIWAFASLLHLDRKSFLDVLGKLYTALKHGGVLYLDMKLKADFSQNEGDLYVSYYSKETLFNLLESNKFSIKEYSITKDVLGRDLNWISIVAKK